MDTIYLLSSFVYIDRLLEGFALNDEDLRQIALNDYCFRPEDGEVQVEVRPPGKPGFVRISSEDGRVLAMFYIVEIKRIT